MNNADIEKLIKILDKMNDNAATLGKVVDVLAEKVNNLEKSIKDIKSGKNGNQNPQ
jgi:prefoldin subunit 5